MPLPGPFVRVMFQFTPLMRGATSANVVPVNSSSFNSRPSCEGRPRQKLNFAWFSVLEAPRRCYYIKDYESQMSKIDDFVVCCLYDVAENGRSFREPPGENM